MTEAQMLAAMPQVAAREVAAARKAGLYLVTWNRIGAAAVHSTGRPPNAALARVLTAILHQVDTFPDLVTRFPAIPAAQMKGILDSLFKRGFIERAGLKRGPVRDRTVLRLTGAGSAWLDGGAS